MPTTPPKGRGPAVARETVVLKVGGSVAREDDAALDLVASLNDAGRPLVVVHGGGPLIGEWASKLGLETKFEQGVRGKDGRVIASLDRERAKALVDDGTIEGGMLPKVEACLVAAQAGCRAAIVSARDMDAVDALLGGEQAGTVFEAAA